MSTGPKSGRMANFGQTVRFGPAEAVWREQHNHMVEQHGSLNVPKRPGCEDIRSPDVGGAKRLRPLLVTVPPLCDAVDVTLAHGLWQRHRACRINRCVWKAAAYQTLVLAGRLVPQSMSPRERAAARGSNTRERPKATRHCPAGTRRGCYVRCWTGSRLWLAIRRGRAWVSIAPRWTAGWPSGG